MHYSLVSNTDGGMVKLTGFDSSQWSEGESAGFWLESLKVKARQQLVQLGAIP